MSGSASLKPSMRTLGALLITLSAITPASSVFILGPGVIQQAGSGAFLTFIAAAVICIFTAFVYSELGSAFPLAGGEYAIVNRVLGHFWGTLVLGANLSLALLSLAILAVGITSYLKPFFPTLDPVTVGVITTAVATAASLLNIRANAIITGIFLGLEFLALAILTYFGLDDPQRSLSNLTFAPMHLGNSGALEPASLNTIGFAAAVAIFAYNGYGQAVYLGEEMHGAHKRIARTIFLALAITVCAEAVPLTSVLLGAPDLQALFSSPNMLSDFITLKGSPTLAKFFSASIALAILNADIAFMIMVARIIYSTGRDQIWNAATNRALVKINRFDTPWGATLVCGGLSMAACFIDQNFLLVITGTSIVFVYAMMCIAALVGRHKQTTAHRAYHMPLYPLAPLLALGAMGYVGYANFLDANTGRPSLCATGAIIVISACYYAVVLRRRGNTTPLTSK